MENNFYQDLLFILENNKITTLPRQELINNDESVALAVWKNFTVKNDYYDYGDYEDVSFNEWYKEGNWKEVLSNYKENMQFWEKAMTDTHFSPYQLLSDNDFKKDFPEVVNQFIADKNFMTHLVHHSDNLHVFDLVSDKVFAQDEIDSLYKNAILKNPQSFHNSKIRSFEHDSNFVTTLLTKYPGEYYLLNQENKENDQYITLALKDKSNLNNIPKNKVDNYVEAWLEVHKNGKFYQNEIETLTEKQKHALLNERTDLLAIVLEKEFSPYKDLAINLLQKDFDKNIDYFNNIQVMRLFSYKEDLDKIKPMLQNFAENYDNPKQLSKKESKIIGLVSLDKVAKQKLESNIFYQLNVMSSQQKIPVEVFDAYFKNVEDRVNNEGLSLEKANAFLARLKNKLSSEVLAEKKYPEKDLYEYLSNQKQAPKMKM